MTFEKYWQSICRGWRDQMELSELSVKDAMAQGWHAALDQAKPVADILYVDYPCNGLTKNQGKAFWTVRNTSATVILNSENEAKSWALKNGYRLK